jgi:hypothetical protein
MMYKFIDIPTNAMDVCFLNSYDMLWVIKETYFERVHSYKCDATEFHWQQLTLHLVVVVLKNLIRERMMFVVELYSYLVQTEKRDNEQFMDFRRMNANVFLFDFFGEIEQGQRYNHWRLEFEKSATLLKLLAMFGCSKAVVVTLRCIPNETIQERVLNLFNKVVTACILEGHVSTFDTLTTQNETSTMSKLYCASKGLRTSNTYILDLMTHLEQQVITIFESRLDTHTKASCALQVIR